MKTKLLIFMAVCSIAASAKVPTDSIRLSDPAVLVADGKYYMTGTGGKLWVSDDLQMWDGPMDVAVTDSIKWMGSKPEIWAAELHECDGKYYYFATFTNNGLRIDGGQFPRRACHVLRAYSPAGPYLPFGDDEYLPAEWLTLDGTYWIDADGKPYMVFCHEWLQNHDGTIEKIELRPDLSGTVGESQLMFRASASPWSREKTDDGSVRPNMVTDGPWVFRTGTGRLGIIWTSWIEDVYTQGVAYSQSGTLDGPWVQEPNPITPPNYGHGMIFRALDGQLYLSCHSHADINGRYVRVPHFFPIDLSGDHLVVFE